MPNQKQRTATRKSPQQKRSRVLVDSILQAATQVLREVGFDRGTTNRIAEVAGVSIGSIYQYFPGKEALVGALIDHQVTRNLAQIETAMETVNSSTLELALEKLVTDIVDLFVSEAGFFKKLFSVAPRVGRLDILIKSREKGCLLFEKVLNRYQDRLVGKSIPVLAFMSVNAVMGVIQMAGLSGLPDSLDRDNLSKELGLLIKAYLLYPHDSDREI